jgi:hypothetical protein
LKKNKIQNPSKIEGFANFEISNQAGMFTTSKSQESVQTPSDIMSAFLCLYSHAYTDERCRGYRNCLNTIAFLEVGQRQVRHRFLLHDTSNHQQIMCSSEDHLRENLTAEELLQSFLTPDIDLIELERVQSDLLMHYFRPESDSYPSRERAAQVLDQSETMMKILRQIWDFGQGNGIRRW